jgi:hypothetical protein
MTESEWSERSCPSCGFDKTNLEADISSISPAENLSFKEIKNS